MAHPDDDALDASPIKPVSSLRSKFEVLAKKPTSLPLTLATSQRLSSGHDHALPGRLSLDSPRNQPGTDDYIGAHRLGTETYASHLRHSNTSSPKSSSMVDLTLAPSVTVDSPRSPPPSLSPRSFYLTPVRHTLNETPRSSTGHDRSAEVTVARPPPVNRAGKPNLVAWQDQPPPFEQQRTPPADPSPFSTPPSSSEATPIEHAPRPTFPTQSGHKSSSSARNSYSAPKAVDRSRKPSANGYLSNVHIRAASMSASVDQLTGHFDPEVTRPMLAPTRPLIPSSSSQESLPLLSARHSVIIAQSSPPLPMRSSALTQGFSAATTTVPVAKSPPPAVPAPRRSADMRRSSDNRREAIPATFVSNRNLVTAQSDGAVGASLLATSEPFIPAGIGHNESDFPDASQSNRRPPRAKIKAAEIGTGYDTRLCAIVGEFVCTTGYVTRIWSTETGQSLASIIHGENIRVTSLCSKPSKELIDNDKRLWLGTGDGSILELDIAAGVVVHDRPHAHPRSSVIKIYRHGSDMMSLDDDGRLLAWRPHAEDAPSLGDTPTTFRVAKGHAASIITRDQLWIATGKDIRVYRLGARSDADLHILQRPLNQDTAGEITSAATLGDQSSEVYFGHVDGKVSIYNRNDFSCLGVVNVSAYKISILTGVGSYLWAGYNTGSINVYDTSTLPWRVVKTWKAHANPVAAIVLDHLTVWETGDVQVLSLGTDNVLRVWDGLLEDDWVVEEIQKHNVEYCEFEELHASVLTWNAGATKPSSLRSHSADSNFFKTYLHDDHVAADILVFGFQELVDLEDKKLTAKSLFKSKKKDPSEQEHMSHQYRAWRDYLVKCVDEHVPRDVSYTLLHTATMIGLFSCVFVRSELRPRIKHVSVGEVKRGIGGLHGNKGALLLRLVLDHSSICFINCHLAAGQSQTTNRHNDVTAILDSKILPICVSVDDAFVGGGDGTMILDHETCILNGDLNYRIDAMTRDAIVRCVREGNLTKLLDRDQLLLSRKRNPGFRLRDFTELPITFAPTYKYNVGTDEYDTSEKKRSPAWCDRILFRGPGRTMCTEYRRWDGVKASDHRPVSGRFVIRVKRVDGARRERVQQRAQKAFIRLKSRALYDVKCDILTNLWGLTDEDATKCLRS